MSTKKASPNYEKQIQDMMSENVMLTTKIQSLEEEIDFRNRYIQQLEQGNYLQHCDNISQYFKH